jgi:glyoxylase-like metal-dependent hydrolase (beta-lactamase superfamily II)/ferredoxin
MASHERRLPTNVEGDFFVDESCIDCGACRWIAPETFDWKAGRSRVHAQPPTAREERRALMSLVACPTGSIGAQGDHDVKAAQREFPALIEGDVFHAGFHSEKSFGATSYLIRRSEGNVLVDSPRWNRGLADRIAALGGVSLIFLTHRDDVADQAKWAERFGASRIIHASDRGPSTRDVERAIEGDAPVAIAPDLTVIPTPGHTRGSACLLHRDRFLFTGDHLAYDLDTRAVTAFRGACWYDWEAQIESMKRLLDFTFEWILPGHEAPCRFDAAEMREQVRRCVAWMERVR